MSINLDELNDETTHISSLGKRLVKRERVSFDELRAVLGDVAPVPGDNSAARDRLIERARISFHELREYRDPEDAADVREYLIYANAGFGDLDETGTKTDREMEREYGDLLKSAYKEQAKGALDDILLYGNARKIDLMFKYLERAGASIQDLAREIDKTQEEIMQEILIAVQDGPRRAAAFYRRKRLFAEPNS